MVGATRTSTAPVCVGATNASDSVHSLGLDAGPASSSTTMERPVRGPHRVQSVEHDDDAEALRGMHAQHLAHLDAAFGRRGVNS